MSKEQLPTSKSVDHDEWRKQIQLLQQELDEIKKRTYNFEVLLRSHVSDYVVEAQELFVLYKQIKKAKKAKRLEQKKRGKNYKEPKGLQVTDREPNIVIRPEEQKEKRRLYREAMLHVHPDKFHMKNEEADVATELTSRLISIYKTESLEALQAFHAHIFKGNANIVLGDTASQVKVGSKDDFLKLEVERLEQDILTAKESHLYKVLHEYENPLTFIDELKVYYQDRIFKLKKRTRKGL